MTGRFDFNGHGEMIFVDKPQNWTSFDVVRKVRNLFHIRKIGHAGTLDPMATGLLILCTGPRTKDLNGLIGQDKTYSGSFEIGIQTPSYDLETDVSERLPWSHVTPDSLRETVASFEGDQEQLPPMYSAVKHKGKALYKYARAGKSIERSPRQVVVHSFRVTGISLPAVDFSLRCSKGTYVRSLIHDIGQTLGTGAVLTSLRRETIGDWHVNDAYSIEDLVRMRDEELSPGTGSHDPVVNA